MAISTPATITPRVLQRIGAVVNGGHLPVQGVAGTSTAQVGTVTMGFKADNGETVIVHSHQVAVLSMINCDADVRLMPSGYEFEFASLNESVAGHAAGMACQPPRHGYVVTCDTMCRMKGGRVIRRP
uniref:Uncharacterized protein n=1 Tax=Rhizobium leguminosarum TaxID=384 RepID=A0A154IE49_RHILE|nr:hypothetical protein A4A59_25240 [Rhizobium leguminosarum]